jgi:thiamine-phosphate pyrophosphorylase
VCALSSSLAARNFPILCYVTDRRSLPAQAQALSAIAGKIEAVLAAGIDWIQIREKDLSARELAALTRESLRHVAALPPGQSFAPRVLVNERLDVALVERAGGVHLGESSLPVAEARRMVATRTSVQDFLIGASCHSVEAALAAADDGADYVFFGPVFATPSKAAFGVPQGVGRLAEVCRAVPIPVLAIGGITLENASACFGADVAGIAAIRLFQDALDPAATVGTLRRLYG